MKNIEIWVVKDPEGSIWKTPKGKTTWNSKGAAKNAWGCHTWFDRGPNPYNPKLRRSTQGRWTKDAEGWTTELVKEYKVTEV
tara:strand:+ start:286 stop:531 length:246 start_codon:yes stop_codon:yes gene_type:complete